MAGLFATEAMVGGEANPYANQAVSMKVVMHRYMMNRTQLENIIRNKIFLPMAVRRGYVKKSDMDSGRGISHSKYDLPKFFWQKLNLMNNQAEMEMMMRLRKELEIPFEVLADTFGWDVGVLKEGWRREQSTIIDPLWRKSREEIAKDPKVRNQILEGKKVDELIIPPAPEEETKKPSKASPGRPKIPEGMKSVPEPAMIPEGPGAASPRTKQEEKGTLPAPIGEGTPPA
jgi:hypothetical protein